MSYFRGLKLTKRGEELLARVNGNINETITFTAGEIGAGEIESDDEIRFLSSLKDKWGDLTITDIKRTGEDKTIVRIETQFSNIGFTEEKILREIGLYAKGKETEPILFGYSNAYEKFDPIPLPEDNPQSFIIGLNFKVSSSTKIDAIISMGGFITIEKFNDFKAEIEGRTITGIGALTGGGNLKENREIKHLDKEGYKHLPVGGGTGQFLKWLNAGEGEWALLNWESLTGKPSTFPPTTHTHNKFQITDFAHTHIKEEITNFSHTHDDRYFTEAEIEEKFKNFCPYFIGDIYITTLSTNPAVRFLGTTWEKIEGRFLLSTSGSGRSEQTGGSNTVTISKANLPNIKLQVDSFSLGKGTQEITGSFNPGGNRMYADNKVFILGNGGQGSNSGAANDSYNITFKASGNWTGMSTSASPYTSSLGSGTPLDITPAYYTVHVWKRLT